MLISKSLIPLTQKYIDDIGQNSSTTICESFIQLAKTYGDAVFLAAMQKLVAEITLAAPKNQDAKGRLLSRVLSLVFSKSVQNFMSFTSQSFESLPLNQPFLGDFFSKTQLRFDQKCVLALSLCLSLNPLLRSEGKAFFSDAAFYDSLLTALEQKAFSMRCLHELLFQFQKSGQFSKEQREQFVSFVGEQSKKTKNLQKSIRLMVFNQTLFNYNREKEKTKQLKNYCRKNVCGTFSLAKELSPHIFSAQKHLIDFIANAEIKTDADLSPLLCAFILSDKKVSPENTPNPPEKSLARLAADAFAKLSKNAQSTKPSMDLSESLEKGPKRDKIASFLKIIEEVFSEVSWLSVVKSMDFGSLSAGGSEEMENLALLFTLLPGGCREAFLEKLYCGGWPCSQRKWAFFEASMAFPEEFALRSKRQLKGEKNFENFLSAANEKSAGKTQSRETFPRVDDSFYKNFYSLDLVSLLLRIGEESAAFRFRAAAVFGRVLGKSPLVVFTALSNLPTNKSSFGRLIAKNLFRQLKAKKSSLYGSITAIDVTFSVKLFSSFFPLNSPHSKDFFEAIISAVNRNPKKIESLVRSCGKNSAFAVELGVHCFNKRLFLGFQRWVSRCLGDKNALGFKEAVYTLLEHNLRESRLGISAEVDWKEKQKKILPKNTIEIFSELFKSRKMDSLKTQFSTLRRFLGENTSKNTFQRFLSSELKNDEGKVDFLEKLNSPEKESFARWLLFETKYFALEQKQAIRKSARVFEFLVRSKDKTFSNKLMRDFEQKLIMFLLLPSDSNLFFFVVSVLLAFVGSLEIFPDFCKALLANNKVRSILPTTLRFEEMNRASCEKEGKKSNYASAKGDSRKQGRNDAVAKQSGGKRQSNTGGIAKSESPNDPKRPHGDANKADQLKENDSEDERLKQKITSMLNNLSHSNYSATSHYIDDKLPTKYYPYFAEYFVRQKISIEGNFHEVYFNLYQFILNDNVRDAIIKSTYKQVEELVTREALRDESKNKKLFNIGNWMGGILLKNNEPVLLRHVDVKEKVLDAFFCEGPPSPLLPAVKFASKLLAHSTQSKIFAPPNPWLMGILGLLKEIYGREEVELNVKFEIEELLKTLEININYIGDTYAILLRNFGNSVQAHALKMGERKAKGLRSKGGAARPREGPGNAGQMLAKGLESIGGAPLSNWEYFSNEKGEISADKISLFTEHFICDYIQKNAKTSALPDNLSNAQTKRIIVEVMAKVVSESFVAIIDRCVRIAGATAWELMLKDFNHEPDAKVYRKFALSVAGSLAGSISLAICKDPLRMEVYSALKTVLKQQLENTETLKKVASALTRESFAVFCRAVCEITAILVQKEIEQAIEPSLNLRQRYQSNGLYFPGEGVIPGKGLDLSRTTFCTEMEQKQPLYPNCLPFELQPKRNGLSKEQLSLYRNYEKLFVENMKRLEEWVEETDFYPICIEDENLEEVTLERGTLRQDVLENFDLEGKAEYPNMEFLDKVIDQFEGNRSPHFIGDEYAETIDFNEISNFKMIKNFQTCQITQQYELTSAKVKSYPNSSTTRYSSLKPGEPVLAQINNFLSFLEAECSAANKNKQMTLLLLSDHIYNEMYKLTSSELFLEVSFMALRIIKLKVPGYQNKIPKRLTRFYMCENDCKKYDLNIFIPMITNGLFDVHMVDSYFANLMKSEKPNLHIRSVYFAAFFFNLLVLTKKTFTKNHFPLIFEVFCDIAGGVYNVRSIEKAAFDYFSHVKQLLGGLRPAPKTGREGEKWFAAARENCSKRGAPFKPAVSSDPAEESNRAEAKMFLKEWEKSRQRSVRPAEFVASRASASQLERPGFLRKMIETVFRSVGSGESAPDASKLASFAILFHSIARRATEKPKEKRGDALKEIFGALIGCVADAQKERDFDQRIYYMFLRQFIELFDFRADLKSNSQVELLVMCIECLTYLQPSKCPGFAAAWLDLVANKNFLTPLLKLRNDFSRKCRFHLIRLFCGAFAFIEKLYLSETPSEPLRVFYLGLLRVLSALASDFPSLLAEFYFEFCAAVPPHCAQMRNVVLSCAPNAQAAQVYRSETISSLLGPEPQASKDWETLLGLFDSGEFGARHQGIKSHLDDYLQNVQDANFVDSPEYYSVLASKLSVPPNPDSSCGGYYAPFEFSRRLVCAAVAYVGFGILARLKAESSRAPNFNITAFIDRAFSFFSNLCRALPPEGCYHTVNALLDHVRYRNTHTHLFTIAVLFVYSKGASWNVKEVVIRVLLERLAPLGPHPEGLVSLFVEFATNPYYAVSAECFAACPPQTLIIFNSVYSRFVDDNRNAAGRLRDAELDKMSIERK